MRERKRLTARTRRRRPQPCTRRIAESEVTGEPRERKRLTARTRRRRTTWQTVATCMASMADVSGRDFYAAQAYQAQDIVTFGIRWRDDLCREWRIVHRGSVYQIEQINHLGYRRDFIHVKARMTTGEGA